MFLVIEGCSFLGLMDDPVNLHGIAARILKIVDTCTLEVEFVHPQSKGFPKWARKDDRISFVSSSTLESLGECTAADYQLISPTQFRLYIRGKLPEGISAGMRWMI